MNILNDYFEKLIFTYVEEKQSYAVYVAAIHSMLGADTRRFVLAFVPSHLGIQRKSKLRDLYWKNLQTRLCQKDTYKVSPQSWKQPLGIPQIGLYVKERKTNYSIYEPENKLDFPFEVLMIHTSKKKTIYQYPNNMNIHWAIDQFHTVFNFVENKPNVTNNVIIHPNAQKITMTNPLQHWIQNNQIDNDTYELIK